MSSTDANEYFPSGLREVVEAITSGMFGERDYLSSLVDNIRWRNDFYLIGADF